MFKHVTFRTIMVAVTFILSCRDGPNVIESGDLHIPGDRPDCESCDLTVSPVVEFGAAGPPIGFPSSLVRLRDGRYVLATLVRPAQLDAYDRAGTHLQTVGRLGPGPGEYRLINHLLVRAGNLEVIDGRSRRWSVLSPALEFLSSEPIVSASISLIPHADDSLIVSGGVPIGTDVGAAINVVGPNGRIARSFGPSDLDPRMLDARLRRILARSGNDRIWAARRSEYSIELWTTDGDSIATLIRSPTWFSGDTRARFRRGVPPTPEIDAIREDENGLLWVAISVADDRWAEQFTDRPGDMAYNGDHSRYFDSVIEVLDPANQTIVASTRIDAFVRGFLDDDEIYTYWLTDRDEPRVGVFRLHLRR